MKAANFHKFYFINQSNEPHVKISKLYKLVKINIIYSQSFQSCSPKTCGKHLKLETFEHLKHLKIWKI